MLKTSGKAATLPMILKHNGYHVSFSAPSAGKLVLDWYYLAKGAHLPATVAKARPTPVLITRLNAVFHKPGVAKLTIRLTAAGKKLIRHNTKLRLTAEAMFTPTHGTPITKKRALTLKR